MWYFSVCCESPVRGRPQYGGFVLVDPPGKLPGEEEAGLFEVRAETARDGVVVVWVAGEVDLTVSAALERTLLDASIGTGVRSVVVDLGGLRFLDSSGVHALVKGYQASRDAGRPYTVRGAHGVVARVLHITGVADALGLPPDGVNEYPKGA
jgi:anti-anti-sigma factor